MKRIVTGAAIAAALALGACEGIEGAYVEDSSEITSTSTSSSIPPPPVMPTGQPKATPMPPPVIPPLNTPPGTGGPLRMPAPPAAPAPSPAPTGGPSRMPAPPAAQAPRSFGCTLPNVAVRTEVSGQMQMNCAAPPAPVPAGMKCAAGEQLTYLTRNGASSYQCMK